MLELRTARNELTESRQIFGDAKGAEVGEIGELERRVLKVERPVELEFLEVPVPAKGLGQARPDSVRRVVEPSASDFRLLGNVMVTDVVRAKSAITPEVK